MNASATEVEREFESFVDKLNDPRLDAQQVIESVRSFASVVMWAAVAGQTGALREREVLLLFEQVVYNNLWVEPASCASRRECGQLDTLFGGA